MSRDRWEQRALDILAAIAEIDCFIGNAQRDEFLADAKTLKAVMANLIVIGEAARHIPVDVAAQWPQVPWALMSGMRNRIVHGYYQVDPAIVWDTCRNDLPALVGPLQAMLRTRP